MAAKVGIVLPVYNAQATLEETVSSILCQSYRDFVLIIVNDGSTDNSSSVIDAMEKKDPRILSLKHANRGPGYTRNRGIDVVSERELNYVAFVDADDVWVTKKLEYQMNVISGDESIDVVVTDMIYCDNSHDLESEQIQELTYVDIPDIFQTMCLRNFTFQPTTALVKTELFRDISKYSESDIDLGGEDYLPFLYFAFFDARFVRIPLPLYRERQLSSSLQRSSRTKHMGSGARVRAIRRLMEEHSASPRMTPNRVKLLEAAEDRYRTWMLAGVRESSGYGQAIRESGAQFFHFHNKYFYFRELIKASLYRPYISLVKKS